MGIAFCLCVQGSNLLPLPSLLHHCLPLQTDAGTNAHTKPPHTTTQDWPRGSITDPPAASGESASAADGASELASAASSSPFVSTDEAHGAGSNRYEGEQVSVEDVLAGRRRMAWLLGLWSLYDARTNAVWLAGKLGVCAALCREQSWLA